jgi:hypothetical protein
MEMQDKKLKEKMKKIEKILCVYLEINPQKEY